MNELDAAHRCHGASCGQSKGITKVDRSPSACLNEGVGSDAVNEITRCERSGYRKPITHYKRGGAPGAAIDVSHQASNRTQSQVQTVFERLQNRLPMIRCFGGPVLCSQ